MAGVWGEASPQAPPEARWTAGRSRGASQPWAGGAREGSFMGAEEAREGSFMGAEEAREGDLSHTLY